MTGAATTRWWRPRTLRHQLVLGVSAAVTVVLLVVGIISVVSLRNYVNAMNDAEVRSPGYFFIEEQRDCEIGRNTLSPGIVAMISRQSHHCL